MNIYNPATGAVLADLPQDDPGSIPSKIVRSIQAQPMWAGRPFAERGEIIRRFRALLVERKEILARTLTSEMGKPIAQSRHEIEGTLGRIDYFLDRVPELLHDEVVLLDAQQRLEEKITLQPLGVIANISAWNYPYFVGSNVFVPALLAGNAVLYKPSEHATLTGLAIGEMLLRECGRARRRVPRGHRKGRRRCGAPQASHRRRLLHRLLRHRDGRIAEAAGGPHDPGAARAGRQGSGVRLRRRRRGRRRPRRPGRWRLLQRRPELLLGRADLRPPDVHDAVRRRVREDGRGVRSRAIPPTRPPTSAR